ncbi:MAG: fibronectin type III domain-containing protein [Vicinamibacterales bacterium]
MAIRSRLLCAVLLVLAVSTAARAESVTVAWDPNQEADLAGYLVAWGRASGATEATVDVGTATSWTLSTATPGNTYYFRVYAYNSSGEQSLPSAEISMTVPAGTGGARFTVNRSQLNFAAVKNGTTITSTTPAQSVIVAQNGTTPYPWTATTAASWLRVTPATGTGTGSISVQLATALPIVGTYTTIVSVTSGETLVQVPVRLQVYATGTSTLPYGAFDTPVDGTVNVSGAIPVTGWAMDDVQVAKVQIFRDPVLAEQGLIYIGDATFVSGARPDVEAGFPQAPGADRGGWGFMLLTNMLPDLQLGLATGGNGTFRLHAYAIDAEGQSVALGTKTIGVNNRTADQPFGTIDTPAQGGTVSGSAYVNFGWAVSPGGAIPTDGSTMTVLVDGVTLGHPTYNNYRSDIAAAFPGHANSNGAIAFFILDTTTLSNGVHTISWVVTDNMGKTSGLGSRFFNVLNGSAATARQAAQRAAMTAAVTRAGATSVSAETLAALPVENAAIEVARVAETDNTPQVVMPEWTGEIRLRSREAEPMALTLTSEWDTLGGVYQGFLVVNGELRPLPPGSALDATQGTFTWQPGAGFIGTYRLVFVRTLSDGSKTKVPVRVNIGPKFDRARLDRQQ